MQEQFLDRILTCVDCHGEFIFTAGEQLFFYDKQFKNDPKRCKPCKSRRSGLAAAASGATGPAAAGLSRTETRTHCSECGIDTTVPFKPTQGRPVLCRQCFQIKNRAAAPLPLQTPVPTPALILPTPPLPQGAAMLVSAAAEPNGSTLSPDAAIAAAASVASASPQSSVSSSADLAYVASLDAPPPSPSRLTAQLTAQIIASSPAELLTPTTPTQELQPVSAELPQA